MITYPCAKINLGLNVVARRDDGYHNLETVFFPVGLCDRLEIEEQQKSESSDTPCRLVTDGISIAGSPKDNLVVKAYELVRSLHPELPQVNIKLTKNIPSQAGLGGGSADCAYTIKMLNNMFNINMSTSDMQQLASYLGADCPFFINPVPSFATGIGEQLMPIDVNLSGYYIAIVKPDVMISTREAFAHITPHQPVICCKDIVRMPIEDWRERLVNDFEESIGCKHAEIGHIKQVLYDEGAVYAAMSGSGSAVFGIFRHHPEHVRRIFNRYFTSIVQIS